jgi:hypothetical protein
VVEVVATLPLRRATPYHSVAALHHPEDQKSPKIEKHGRISSQISSHTAGLESTRLPSAVLTQKNGINIREYNSREVDKAGIRIAY